MVYLNITVAKMKESLTPIAVYDAVWIPFASVLIHMTLIEQSMSKAKNVYWIRVGAVYESTLDPSDVDSSLLERGDGSDEAENAGQQLQVLAVLSNEVGRLIIDQTDDWVDLAAVRHSLLALLRLLD